MSKPTLLLLECNEETRKVLNDMLRHKGYQVIATGIPSTARDVLKGNVDVLITSNLIKSQSGFGSALGFVEEVIRKHPQKGIIMLSGSEKPEELPEQVEFLSKPCTVEVLTAKIEEVFAGQKK